MGASRQERINSLVRKLLQRYERKEQKGLIKRRRKALAQKERKRDISGPIIAYDLETTPIKEGTPRPLYITGYSAELHFYISLPVKSVHHLLEILEAHFLLPEFSGCRFVGWNANNFDVYFISAALLHSDDYVLRPYLTKSKKIRGLRVSRSDGEEWEFLDGMAMTGIQKPLKNFLKIFAPDYLKLDAPDFEVDGFDPENPEHQAYAFRDSEGLYHAMMKAESVVYENFGMRLRPTIGNLGIRIFQAHIPQGVRCIPLDATVESIIRRYVMRGGFCYCAKSYYGPVWKYDINQAYAAAMRDTFLPAGRCMKSKGVNPYAKCAIYLVDAVNRKNKVPFYWRTIDGRSCFSFDEMTDCWITSIEYQQLVSEGWNVKVKECYFWDDHFKMTDYVNKLEHLRRNGAGGPKGAQGEMVKAIGNNSYGKTVEQLEGLEIIIAKNPPSGFVPYQDEDDLFKHLWARFSLPDFRDYHQPHIGAFITAHVRMVLRRAILLAPDEWIYADTDGVMFSCPVDLDLDVSRYGAWKLEADGDIYRVITKKVYAKGDGSEKHAKGMNVEKLTAEDFARWQAGDPPRQIQVQRANFLAVMRGEDMFFQREKIGQRTT